MVKKEENSFLQKLSIWGIALSGILMQYKMSVSSLGIIFLLVILLAIILKKKYIYIDQSFLEIITIITVGQIFSILFIGYFNISNLNTILQMWILLACCGISFNIKNKEKFVNTIILVGILCTIVTYVQFIMLTVFKMKISSIILFHFGRTNLNNWYMNSERPMSLFSEPQVYCSMMLPVIILAFSEKRYKTMIFICIGILLSGSSTGILMLLILAAIILLSSNMKTIGKLAIVLGLVVFLIMFEKIGAFEKYREKINSIFNDYSSYSNAEATNNFSYTNYLRLIKSWDTYKDLNLKEKFFGIGINNFANYLSTTNRSFSWNRLWKNDDNLAAYYTSAGGVFIECGFIVAILYYYFILRKIHFASVPSKYIIMLLLIQSFITQFFFNNLFIYYFLVYYVIADEKKLLKVKI